MSNEMHKALTNCEEWVEEYMRKRTGIKEVPLGPISEKLVMLQGYQGEEKYIELKTKWLQEMIDEINAKVQELLKAMHDD